MENKKPKSRRSAAKVRSTAEETKISASNHEPDAPGGSSKKSKVLAAIEAMTSPLSKTQVCEAVGVNKLYINQNPSVRAIYDRKIQELGEKPTKPAIEEGHVIPLPDYEFTDLSEPQPCVFWLGEEQVAGTAIARNGKNWIRIDSDNGQHDVSEDKIVLWGTKNDDEAVELPGGNSENAGSQANDPSADTGNIQTVTEAYRVNQSEPVNSAGIGVPSSDDEGIQEVIAGGDRAGNDAVAVEEITRLSIDDLTIDDRLQPRERLNQDTVEEYAEAFRDGEELPPLDVFNVDGTFYLTAGFTRYAGAQQAGIHWLKCRVHAGDFDDAIVFAAQNNRTNGQRLGEGDARRAARMLLSSPKTQHLSNRAIARMIGSTNHKMVGDVRAALASSGELPEDAVRTRTGMSPEGHTIEELRDMYAPWGEFVKTKDTRMRYALERPGKTLYFRGLDEAFNSFEKITAEYCKLEELKIRQRSGVVTEFSPNHHNFGDASPNSGADYEEFLEASEDWGKSGQQRSSDPDITPTFAVGDSVVIENNIYGKRGTISTIEAVQENGWYATADGVYHGRYLKPAQQPIDRATHARQVCTSAKSHDHYTPADILKAVYECLGEVELDPCSNSNDPAIANVRANRYFTKEDDGLTQEWKASTLYMNPPFSVPVLDAAGEPELNSKGEPKMRGAMEDWITKLTIEHAAGNVQEAICLVKGDTSTDWSQLLRDYIRCEYHGRPTFVGNECAATFAVHLYYLGNNPERFYDAFEGLGDIWQRLDRDSLAF